MGHPDRKLLREKKKAKQMLDRKSALNILDLTPHNAVGRMNYKGYDIKLK